MEQGQDWVKRLTAEVGKRVAFYRQRRTADDGRRLTAKDLADLCAREGLKIDRPAIAKLESGHRQSISVAEVLVLARALRVAPALLLFPLGTADMAEVLPGKHAATLDAILWLIGSADLHDPEPDGFMPSEQEPIPFSVRGTETSDVGLFRLHPILVQGVLRDMGRLAAKPLDLPDLPDEEESRARLEGSTMSLMLLRQTIRDRGLTPPPLPDELAHLAGEAADG